MTSMPSSSLPSAPPDIDLTQGAETEHTFLSNIEEPIVQIGNVFATSERLHTPTWSTRVASSKWDTSEQFDSGKYASERSVWVMLGALVAPTIFLLLGGVADFFVVMYFVTAIPAFIGAAYFIHHDKQHYAFGIVDVSVQSGSHKHVVRLPVGSAKELADLKGAIRQICAFAETTELV